MKKKRVRMTRRGFLRASAGAAAVAGLRPRGSRTPRLPDATLPPRWPEEDVVAEGPPERR